MNARLILAVLALGALTGCTKYYAVTDPASGKTYYTQNVSDRFSGAVRLKDARTGDMVTLQNSEVRSISEQEYRQGMTARPEAMPAGAILIPPPPRDIDRDDSDLQIQP